MNDDEEVRATSFIIIKEVSVLNKVASSFWRAKIGIWESIPTEVIIPSLLDLLAW